jgi:hypothetical protein
MIGASKILTVSYGTFSCTLEGFDDPFNTMKAIAEYFRDLAAEDRYFGAEPPTPDAAMLHKIAEREIQRRVEAKIQENGVILRAGDAAGREDPAPRPAPALLPEPVAPALAAAPVTAAPVTAAPVEAAPPEPALSEPALSESVAAKLQRIRAAHAAAAPAVMPLATAAAADPATEFPAAEFSTEDYSEDQHAELGDNADVTELLAALAEDAVPAEADPVADLQPFAPPAGDEADLLPESYEIASSEDLAEDLGGLVADAADETVAETVDAWDQVAVGDDPVAGLDDLIDDLPEDDLSAGTDADLEQALAGDAPAVAPVAEFDDSDDDGFLSSLQSQLSEAEPEPEPEVTAPPAAPLGWSEADLDDTGLDDTDLEEPAESAALLDEAIEDEAFEDEAFEDEAAQVEAVPADPLAAEADAEPALSEPAPAVAPAVAERAQRARARVIKIRRALPADAETEVGSGEASATEAQPDLGAGDALPSSSPLPSSLSPEDEEDLMRELAALEEDTPRTEPNPARTAAPSDASATAPVRPQRPVAPSRPAAGAARQTLQGAATGRDESVSRLIAQTNSQMEGPENRRRLSAIAHLKAAVVATVADRRAGGDAGPSENDRIDPYKNDLSRIVRPVSPRTAGAERPSPLVLVSEQRIDRRASEPAPAAAAASGPVAPVSPVRPRRLSAGAAAASSAALREPDLDEDEDDTDEDANIFVDARGFADFADRLGAQSLSDLLEAAAAYTACVEGRPHFTRPQLIRQIAALGPQANREDSLRGFGTLLRDGKIERVKRGQYALTDQSHFLAEAKKIVG